MTEISPAVLALKAELGQAIRRDHDRRRRRRKTIRTGVLSLLGVAVLSGGALASAGDVPLEEVQFARGVSVEAVKSYPEFTGHGNEEFVTSAGSSRAGTFIYHVTGGEAREIGCGPTDPHPTNNVYIMSTRPLTSAEIKTQLRPDGELEGHSPRLPGVTSESNGCPNPGVAGQPGALHSRSRPGKAAVTVAPSNRTPEILPNETPTTAASGRKPTTSITGAKPTATTPGLTSTSTNPSQAPPAPEPTTPATTTTTAP
jgi:hypothetical protein